MFLPKDFSRFLGCTVATFLIFLIFQLEVKHHKQVLHPDLTEKYRLVIVLRDIEGFSTTETAQILNLSDANVKVRLHRARLFLRDKLKGYFENE
mgnify:CR=1 FL=1